MDRQTKSLLVGTGLALLILIAGYMTSIYDNSQLSSKVEKCKTMNVQAAQAPKNPKLPPWAVAIPMVCEPDSLAKLRVDDAAGIQKQIVEALASSGKTFNYAKIIAPLTFLLFCLPYAWYFLLRRIREFRDAIAGQR
jgi:hypothetical protein